MALPCLGYSGIVNLGRRFRNAVEHHACERIDQRKLRLNRRGESLQFPAMLFQCRRDLALDLRSSGLPSAQFVLYGCPEERRNRGVAVRSDRIPDLLLQGFG